MNEDEYLASYDPRAYPPVAVTVDVVALTIRDGAAGRTAFPDQRAARLAARTAS